MARAAAQGGHFVAHQDTEKEPGMFGMLVVQLPADGGHAGGALRVRHKGREVACDFAKGRACARRKRLKARDRSASCWFLRCTAFSCAALQWQPASLAALLHHALSK